jgi:hypothetical protein
MMFVSPAQVAGNGTFARHLVEPRCLTLKPRTRGEWVQSWATKVCGSGFAGIWLNDEGDCPGQQRAGLSSAPAAGASRPTERGWLMEETAVVGSDEIRSTSGWTHRLALGSGVPGCDPRCCVAASSTLDCLPARGAPERTAVAVNASLLEDKGDRRDAAIALQAKPAERLSPGSAGHVLSEHVDEPGMSDEKRRPIHLALSRAPDAEPVNRHAGASNVAHAVRAAEQGLSER